MTKGNQNRDELIQSLQERLRWYMSEASEEEFDADEVEAIGRLLEAMDGDNWEKPDAEAAYERFQAYCRERELEEKAGRYAFAAGTDSAEEFSEELAPEKAAGSLESGRAKRAARETEAGRASATEDISSGTDAVGTEVLAGTDAVGTEIPAGTGKRRKSGKNRVLRRTWAAVAAALCLMFLGVGGVSMALNDGGWFTRLSDNHSGEDMLVMPENDEIFLNDYISKIYYNYEDMKEENQELAAFLDLDIFGLEFNRAIVTQMIDITEILLYYNSEKDKELIVDCYVFDDKNALLYRKSYDVESNLGTKECNGIEYSCYKLKNQNEDKFLISFDLNNMLFNINGSVSIEDMEEIVGMIIGMLVKK